MDKKAFLEKIYNSAFNDELEKISRMTPLQKADKSVREAQRIKEMEEGLEGAEKRYATTIKPYAKHRRVVKGGATAGALLGSLLAAPKGKFRLARLLAGASVGSLLGTGTAHNTLSYVDPKYKSTMNKALNQYWKDEDKAIR